MSALNPRLSGFVRASKARAPTGRPYVVMPMRTHLSSRKPLAVALLLLAAALLGSCSSRNCVQPDLQDAIFNTPWSTNTKPDQAYCTDDSQALRIDFTITFEKDPDATQRAQRLEQAAQQAGMTTSPTSSIGGFKGLSGADVTLKVAVGENGDWVVRVILQRGFGEDSGIHPISPELQALLDAVAATN